MAADYDKSGSWGTSAVGVGLVWTAGIVFSFISFRLAISGRLWDYGFPPWLITLTVLVGIWQWVWIAPMLTFARGRKLYALYNGLLRGGISFSFLQLAICIVLYFIFRKVSLQ